MKLVGRFKLASHAHLKLGATENGFDRQLSLNYLINNINEGKLNYFVLSILLLSEQETFLNLARAGNSFNLGRS